MQYVISFLEGIITFISPCLLPMLPVYISYFAGGGERSQDRTFRGALGFVLGFTVVFVTMGALAGTAGSFFIHHRSAVNTVSGLIVIFFGLSYLGLFSFLPGGRRKLFSVSGNAGFFRSVLFGIVFSVGWTPCAGAFLGSALMLASRQGHTAEGMLMLLAYSSGLGIPFVLSAVMIDYLKSAFDFIKRNYGIINRICALLLILTGILMAAGVFGKFLEMPF